MNVNGLAVREFLLSDEADWLRCRAIAFLETSYFDDVVRSKPAYPHGAIELVAERDGVLVGLVDVRVVGELATIETIAVHPEASRSGVASALLEETTRRLPTTVTALDAWTREDAPANSWYLSQGFKERFRYLHVFATDDSEMQRAVRSSRKGLLPVSGFFHANTEDEEELRREFRRVHICRQYVRPSRGPVRRSLG